MEVKTDDAFRRIAFGRRGGVGVLCLNDPPVRNAISEQMRDEVLLACDVFENDEETTSILVMGAKGNFSSGADLREFGRASSVASARAVRRDHNVYRRLLELPLPTVALIEGVAVGGGLELALCCDVRIGAAGCRMGVPEVRRGFIPGGGGTQLLGRRTGTRNTDQLLVQGHLVGADEALRLGLLHELFPTYAQARERAWALAVEMSQISRALSGHVKNELIAAS